MSQRRHLAVLIVLALVAGPACAYTIFLKDGSKIIARQEYKVEGDRAIIILQNGTQTFLGLDEIDVERTRQANTSELGNALVLQEGRFVDITEAEKASRPQQESLEDLIASGRATASSVPRAGTSELEIGTPTPTEPAERSTLADPELLSLVQDIFDDRGLSDFTMYERNEDGSALLEVTTDSEAAVFRSIEGAARILARANEDRRGSLDAIELVMSTSNHAAAGRFHLTQKQVKELLEDKADLPTFYIRNVIF